MLWKLNDLFQAHDFSLSDKYLPTPTEKRQNDMPALLRSALDYDTDELWESIKGKYASLNSDQQYVVDEICTAVFRNDGGVFFIDAPGIIFPSEKSYEF